MGHRVEDVAPEVGAIELSCSGETGSVTGAWTPVGVVFFVVSVGGLGCLRTRGTSPTPTNR